MRKLNWGIIGLGRIAEIFSEGFSDDALIKEAIDQVSVFFGKEILKIIIFHCTCEQD